MTAADFWSHVERKGPDECWHWLGGTDSNGYGTLNFCGEACRAHRVAWILTFGPVLGKLFVLHTCDNPPCCNPNHLYPGTQKKNIEDCLARNRFIGGGTANAKLTGTKIRQIQAASQSGMTQVNIAAQFDINQSTVSRVLNHKRWNRIKPQD